jgi:hypothetical protein
MDNNNYNIKLTIEEEAEVELLNNLSIYIDDEKYSHSSEYISCINNLVKVFRKHNPELKLQTIFNNISKYIRCITNYNNDRQLYYYTYILCIIISKLSVELECCEQDCDDNDDNEDDKTVKQAICNMTIYMTALCGDYTQIKLAKIAIAVCAPDIIMSSFL